MTRRQCLVGLAAAASSVWLPAPIAAAPGTDSRSLRFLHLHTGERLTVEYFNRGLLVPDGLAAVNHLLRDFRTNELHDIDPALLDLLHRLAESTGTHAPWQVISGYRSPATNEMLRRKSEGVSAGSLHMVGQAVDVRLGDVRLAHLRDAALAVGRGGVGYYPTSEFVHVDTGRRRRW
jgi:uncharacterized protein YcbK (DUF882 family)